MRTESFTPYAVLILLTLIIVLGIVSLHSEDPLYTSATTADKSAVLGAPSLGVSNANILSRGLAPVIARSGLR